MDNNALIHCVNCGHMVSKNAKQCPHCESADFMGKKCEFCNKRSPQREVIEINSFYAMRNYASFYAHEECFRHLLKIDHIDNAGFSCRDCHSLVREEQIKRSLIKSYQSRQSPQLICSNCGSTKAISHLMEPCFFCGTSILKGFHDYETLKIIDSSYYHSKVIKKVFLHKRCTHKINPLIIADKKEPPRSPIIRFLNSLTH